LNEDEENYQEYDEIKENIKINDQASKGNKSGLNLPQHEFELDQKSKKKRDRNEIIPFKVNKIKEMK